METTAITDPMLAQIDPRWIEIGTDLGLRVAGALVILFIGWTVSGWAQGAVRRAMKRAKRVDATLKPLFLSLVRWTVMIVTLVIVLNTFGVAATSLLAVMGAAGLAIGLALQGTLSNVAAGVMLLTLRPIRVGEFADVGGESGTVNRIDLFTTELLTVDNIFISVPNSTAWGGTITNYSRMPVRRFNLTIGIDYDDDVDQALGVLMDTMKADGRILQDPAPSVGVSEFGGSSVDLFVRGYANTGDYWPVVNDLKRSIKLAFDREGITFPFPQTTFGMRPENDNPLERAGAPSQTTA